MLRVSPRLRADFGDGDCLYALAERGDTIRLPRRRRDAPSRESFEWHADTVFLAS